VTRSNRAARDQVGRLEHPRGGRGERRRADPARNELSELDSEVASRAGGDEVEAVERL